MDVAMVTFFTTLWINLFWNASSASLGDLWQYLNIFELDFGALGLQFFMICCVYRDAATWSYQKSVWLVFSWLPLTSDETLIYQILCLCNWLVPWLDMHLSRNAKNICPCDTDDPDIAPWWLLKEMQVEVASTFASLFRPWSYINLLFRFFSHVTTKHTLLCYCLLFWICDPVVNKASFTHFFPSRLVGNHLAATALEGEMFVPWLVSKWFASLQTFKLLSKE